MKKPEETTEVNRSSEALNVDARVYEVIAAAVALRSVQEGPKSWSMIRAASDAAVRLHVALDALPAAVHRSDTAKVK